MTSGHRVSSLQRAWLDELGVDTHWLSVPASPGRGPDPVAGASAGPAEAAPAPVAAVRPALQRRSDPVGETPVSADSGLSVPDGLDDTPEALALAVQASLRDVPGGPRGPGVPGAGMRVSPRYFLVGGQPGLEDEAAGRPFEGDSGQLLRTMLQAARLPQPDEVYCTTLVKCRAAGGRAPSPGEISACAPYLRREIAWVRPQWILALGEVAAQALLQCADDLESLRGRRHAWAGPDGLTVPVWVTYHPSSLLVRSAHKLDAWRDLVALAEWVRSSRP